MTPRRPRSLRDLLPPAGDGSDLVAVGETMGLIAPTDAAALEESGHLELLSGGAESNVAMHLAQLGYATRWVSRLGDDPFGRVVLRDVAAAGVDVDAVRIDAEARTGVYFKDPGHDGTTVHYYRDGSAASRMGPEVLDDARIAAARIVHLSGITAPLSASCLGLLRAALIERVVPSALVSFDVNHRPGLWHAAEAAAVLAELADASDVVFVGMDEAERLWGCANADEVRDVLPSPCRVVIKDADVAAHAIGQDGVVSTPALAVEVVEPVGAGDAFAAGYLAGLLQGEDDGSCLRFGHLMAACILQVHGDQAPLPPRSWFVDRADPAASWGGAAPEGLARG